MKPWHRLVHRLQDCWATIEHLPVPGYTQLVRQRCTVCGDTRVEDLGVRKVKTP